jgi:hypothetical protein
MSVPDRYYSAKEYKGLSLEKRAGLKQMREKRGGPKRRGGKPHDKKRKVSKDKGGKQQGMHLSHGSIKALVTAMKDDDTEVTSPAEDSDSDDESVQMAAPASKKQKKQNNRNNPALKRQRNKK